VPARDIAAIVPRYARLPGHAGGSGSIHKRAEFDVRVLQSVERRRDRAIDFTCRSTAKKGSAERSCIAICTTIARACFTRSPDRGVPFVAQDSSAPARRSRAPGSSR
jgi:hypothetical protein